MGDANSSGSDWQLARADAVLAKPKKLSSIAENTHLTNRELLILRQGLLGGSTAEAHG
jgi:hypothetical protein